MTRAHDKRQWVAQARKAERKRRLAERKQAKREAKATAAKAPEPGTEAR